jgi:beta-mannosidase
MNDNLSTVFFGEAARQQLNMTGEQAFKAQLYWSMIGQALVIKQNIELTRSINRFGTLVWQLNEIWPTGGWGSIEYGNPRFEGQSLGGRWKPLQYWFKSSIFADVMATCGRGGLCYVKNDSPRPFQGRLTFAVTELSTAETRTALDVNVSLPAGAGAMEWIHSAVVGAIDGTRQILEAVVTAQDGRTVSRNVIPFATPGLMQV